MAAILCYEEQAANGPVRPLRIVSFENDLDSLRLAFRHSRDFPYLRHSGPAGILKDGAWQSRQYPALSWLLMPGDFLETMSAALAPPDLIFYDMFSTKTSGDQWTLSAFRKLFDACAGRAAELFTWVRYRRPFHPAFAALVPYVVVLAELKAGPRLFGRLRDDREPRTGMALEAVVERWEDGACTLAFEPRRGTA